MLLLLPEWPDTHTVCSACSIFPGSLRIADKTNSITLQIACGPPTIKAPCYSQGALSSVELSFDYAACALQANHRFELSFFRNCRALRQYHRGLCPHPHYMQYYIICNKNFYPISPLTIRYILLSIGSVALFSSRLISVINASSSMSVLLCIFPLDALPFFTI